MNDIVIKIKNLSSNKIPDYATAGSSGLDLRANLNEAILLLPLERKMVPTGIYLELPFGFEGQVRPRSGMAFNQGITCLNSPGTIDSDYRGEVKIILINLSSTAQTIQPGDRIAQLVISRFERVTLTSVKELDESERGEGGFGHTGIN